MQMSGSDPRNSMFAAGGGGGILSRMMVREAGSSGKLSRPPCDLGLKMAAMRGTGRDTV